MANIMSMNNDQLNFYPVSMALIVCSRTSTEAGIFLGLKSFFMLKGRSDGGYKLRIFLVIDNLR